MRIITILLTIMVYPFSNGIAQDSTRQSSKILDFPNRLFSKITNRTQSLDRQLEHQTEKYLQRLTKQEAKLRKELIKHDSAGSAYLFLNNPENKYAVLSNRVKNDTSELLRLRNTEYLPYADSLQGSASFVTKNPQLFNSSPSQIISAQRSITQLRELQSKMQDANYAKQFIEERKEQIKQYIEMHAHLPTGVLAVYSDYNKQFYYYSAQLNEYKDILNDPDKMLKTTLALLNKFPAFTAFMQKNSFLAGIFNVPDNYNMETALPGMQTRDMINQMIQGQVNAGGADAAAALSQGLQSAQGQLQSLKDKISSLGAAGANADLPQNFTPNNQKSKTFLRRLEYGTNLQTVHGSYYFPTTTDLGFSVGYKLDNRNTIGVGASYKIGWGSDISHIHMSSQGAGLRSYTDIKIKGDFFASGGYELNYQPSASGQSGAQLYVLNSWQKSGLIGISKIIPVHTSFFKKTKIQLLWDFLSYEQIPKAQPFKFRVGYNF